MDFLNLFTAALVTINVSTDGKVNVIETVQYKTAGECEQVMMHKREKFKNLPNVEFVCEWNGVNEVRR